MSDSLKDLVAKSSFITTRLIETCGELTPEIEKEISELEVKIPAKIDSYCGLIDRLEAEAEFFEAKSKELQRVSKGLLNLKEKLRERVKFTMLENGLDILEGDNEKFTLSPSKAKLIVDSVNSLPREFQKVEVVVTAENEKIREALQNKVEIPGCRLEPTYALRKSINKRR